MSGHEVVTTQITVSSAEDEKLEYVNCPAGKVVLGGGYATFTNGVVPLRSSPAQGAPDRWDVWVVHVRETIPTSNSWTLWVYAICANAS